MELDDLIMNAREVGPTVGSLTVVAGPPGMGKSWFCGSMAEYLDPSEVLVVATLPRELKSAKYQEHDLDSIVVTDKGWDPENGDLQATGYGTLREVLRTLREDEQYGGLIIDNGTQMGELAWHACLAPFGVADPTELGGGSKWDPYVKMSEKMETLFSDLSYLTGQEGSTVARPKLIAVPWHVQPPKEKPGGDESADEKAKGAEYEGDYLPMVRGSFRRKLASLTDAFVYCDHIKVRAPGSPRGEPRYVVQVRKDRERHVKLPGKMPEADELLKKKYILNHWPDYMDLLEPEED